MSPPLSKDCKHCLAVAAIDAVQLAVVGPANETDAGMLLSFCLRHLILFLKFRHYDQEFVTCDYTKSEWQCIKMAI